MRVRWRWLNPVAAIGTATATPIQATCPLLPSSAAPVANRAVTGGMVMSRAAATFEARLPLPKRAGVVAGFATSRRLASRAHLQTCGAAAIIRAVAMHGAVKHGAVSLAAIIRAVAMHGAVSLAAIVRAVAMSGLCRHA